MDQELTPLDCLLPSGTAFQNPFFPPVQTHCTINHIHRGKWLCVGQQHTNGDLNTAGMYESDQNTFIHVAVTLVLLSRLLPLTQRLGGIKTPKQISGIFMTTVCIYVWDAVRCDFLFVLEGGLNVFSSNVSCLRKTRFEEAFLFQKNDLNNNHSVHSFSLSLSKAHFCCCINFP